MPSEYVIQANELLEKFGVKFEVRRVGNGCPRFCKDMDDMTEAGKFPRKKHMHGDQHLCILTRPGKSAAFDFWNSYQDTNIAKALSDRNFGWWPGLPWYSRVATSMDSYSAMKRWREENKDWSPPPLRLRSAGLPDQVRSWHVQEFLLGVWLLRRLDPGPGDLPRRPRRIREGLPVLHFRRAGTTAGDFVMGYKVSIKDLDSCVSIMNTKAGRPQGFEKGSFMLCAQNGGYCISEKMESGGEKKVFEFGTARETYLQACAWIAGFEVAKKAAP